MKKLLICLWLISCLFILSQAMALAMDADTGGDGGYKPPPYYTPQTAQAPTSFTYTPIPKPPISSFTSTAEPFVAQNYGSELAPSAPAYTSAPAYSSAPASYTPVPVTSTWTPKPAASTAPQPVQNPNNQPEDN